MKKYINVLLAQMIIFGLNNNICYSMEINNSNHILDNNINNYNDNLILRSLLNKYRNLYSENFQLSIYYDILNLNIPVHDETSFLFKHMLADIKSCCFHLKHYCSIHSRIYAGASCKKLENGSIQIVECDKYSLISTHIIPDSQVKDLLNKYSGDNISTLEHFEYYYSTKILEIENNIIQNIIKILTNINIGDNLSERNKDEIIYQIENNIRNINKQDMTDKMKYIIENLITPTLNDLEILKEQIVHLFAGFSELPICKTSTHYNRVLSDLEKALKKYNNYKQYTKLAIKRVKNEISE